VTLTLNESETPIEHGTVVYRAFGVACDQCGRACVEFAHLADGTVFARHSGYRVEWGRIEEWVCRLR
jgi:hypothetical protein